MPLPPVAPPPPAVVATLPSASTVKNAFQTVHLPSELPSGDPSVDAIEFDYYPAQNVPAGTTAPAVVVLPPIGSHAHSPILRRLAQIGVRAGINVAVMTLPYHGGRWPKSEGKNYHPELHFLSGDPTRAAQAFSQSASDVTTIVSWLIQQPGVDGKRLGFVGVSLGAIVGHLAMGRDARLTAGVAFLGAGNLPDIYRRSLLAEYVRRFHPAQHTPPHLTVTEIDRILRRVDPITYADGNRPRNVLMVAGARDVIIPPADAAALWKALGKPPIRWVDTNHLALRLAPDGPLHAAVTYMTAVWAAPNAEAASHVPAPPVHVPTITMGFVAQSHSPNGLGFAPALTYRIGALGSRADHMSLMHIDAGMTPRGPFAAAALTANGYVDVGFASRLGPHSVQTPRPYVGMHVTF